jgi:hypothetical protein
MEETGKNYSILRKLYDAFFTVIDIFFALKCKSR